MIRILAGFVGQIGVKTGGIVVREVLVTGFKGKNNTSAQLVALLPYPHKILLTNSFSGLHRDIELISAEKYASIIMFGIDKTLSDCIRIEQTAVYDGIWQKSAYNVAGLADRLLGADIKYEISSTPTQYLCNAAYFYMLEKCQNSVFIHIPSLHGMTPAFLQKLVSSLTPEKLPEDMEN